MSFIDMHCDTISELMKNGKSLYSSDMEVSIEKMKLSDVFCQFFAMFIRMSEEDARLL